MPAPKVRIARTYAEIEASFSVMADLRPHLRRNLFVARVRKQEEEGYRLTFIAMDGEVRAVAGFRILDNLARQMRIMGYHFSLDV